MKYLLFLFLLTGCHGLPNLGITIWTASSRDEALIDKQNGLIINAKDPQFDNFGCMTYQDWERLFKYVQECQEKKGQ